MGEDIKSNPMQCFYVSKEVDFLREILIWKVLFYPPPTSLPGRG